MPARKKPKSSDPIRDQLLVAAIDLFDRKGYAATTVREIVETVRVSKPVLYYYFRSKDGIFLEIMRDAFARFEQVVAPGDSATKGAEAKIVELCERAFTFFERNIPVVRVMYSVYFGPPQAAPHFDFDAFQRQFQNRVLELVEEGIASGELRPGNPEEMTWAIMGALSVAVEENLSRGVRSVERETFVRILRIIFRGISLGKRAAASGTS